MFKTISVILLMASLAACSTGGPYTGEKVTKTTDATGLTVTRGETREVLPTGGLAGTDSELRQIVATVEAVNPKLRTIAIKTADGKVQTFALGKEVRNLAQVSKGDQVRLNYFESVAFEVRQPTKDEIAASDNAVALIGRSKLGENPEGLVALGGTSVLTIDSINKDKQLVTLRGPRGALTVKAKYPENLNHVKQWETVVVTVTELFAASVDPVS